MQARTIMFLSGLFAVVIITFALLQQPQQGISRADVEAMIDIAIEEKLASFDPTASTNTARAPAVDGDFGSAVENHLMSNPQILQRMANALQAQSELQQNQRAKTALAALKAPLYDDPDHVVLGNPEGDVTIVEFFDYNCGFCRKALADVIQLLDEDKNVRVILKEFPILSQGSVDAARIAVQVARDSNIDYMEFHTRVFSSRGQINKDTALQAAASLGMNPIELELQMNSKSVSDAIARTHQIAEALDITSTPNFILGDEILRGAVGVDEMRAKIKNMRDCGKATCS